MRIDEVPQDHSSTYGGHSKLVYAVDETGHYQRAQSDGWDAEAYATELAVHELEEQEASAWADCRAGRVSPLLPLMYRYRFDEPGLAMAAGLWRWRLRRHFRPAVFRRLPARVLARYAEAFGLSVDDLRRYQQEPGA